VDFVLEKIIQIAANNPKVKKIVLFGSRARGDQNERSDYDLAFFSEIELDLSPLFSEITDHNPSLKKLDLLHFEKARPELKTKILQEGKVIYEAKKN
jgi:uncharacterized protein